MRRAHPHLKVFEQRQLKWAAAFETSAMFFRCGACAPDVWIDPCIEYNPHLFERMGAILVGTRLPPRKLYRGKLTLA